MARHLVSEPLSQFYIRTYPVKEQAHLWTFCGLDNGAKSCQIIMKHDLTHCFYGRTPGVCTTVPVLHQGPSRFGTGPLVDPWLIDNGAKSCQMIIKHYLTHWFHGRAPGVFTTVPVPHQDPSCWGTGLLLEPWLT